MKDGFKYKYITKRIAPTTKSGYTWIYQGNKVILSSVSLEKLFSKIEKEGFSLELLTPTAYSWKMNRLTCQYCDEGLVNNTGTVSYEPNRMVDSVLEDLNDGLSYKEILKKYSDKDISDMYIATLCVKYEDDLLLFERHNVMKGVSEEEFETIYDELDVDVLSHPSQTIPNRLSDLEDRMVRVEYQIEKQQKEEEKRDCKWWRKLLRI